MAATTTSWIIVSFAMLANFKLCESWNFKIGVIGGLEHPPSKKTLCDQIVLKQVPVVTHVGVAICMYT